MTYFRFVLLLSIVGIQIIMVSAFNGCSPVQFSSQQPLPPVPDKPVCSSTANPQISWPKDLYIGEKTSDFNITQLKKFKAIRVDYGDGTIISKDGSENLASTLRHTYLTVGTYIITLKLINSCDQEMQFSDIIVVNPIPGPSCPTNIPDIDGISPLNPEVNQQFSVSFNNFNGWDKVTLTTNNINPIVRAPIASISLAVSNPGTVTLEARFEKGLDCKVTKTRTVNVVPTVPQCPSQSVDFGQIIPAMPLENETFSISFVNIAGWKRVDLNLPSGTITSEPIAPVSTSISLAGNYNLQATFYGDAGCAVSRTASITIAASQCAPENGSCSIDTDCCSGTCQSGACTTGGSGGGVCNCSGRLDRQFSPRLEFLWDGYAGSICRPLAEAACASAPPGYSGSFGAGCSFLFNYWDATCENGILTDD